MDGEGGDIGRRQLEDLVDRARHDLRDWTDTADHDPGVALLQLFALVAELLTSRSETLPVDPLLGSTGRGWSVLPQQGRVVIDADHSEKPAGATCGVHRATVLDEADPLGQRRLLVRVPDVSGDESVWAAACRPVPGAQEVPATGDGVWVAFESCDPSRPIWLGQRVIS